MPSPDREINKLGAPGRSKYPPPFSSRLTFEERARLEAEAGDMPLGAYIRARLLNGEAEPRRPRRRAPVKDDQALGRVLAQLGASRLSSNLNQLAHAVNIGTLPVAPETEQSLVEALRDELMRALGKVPGGPR